MRDRGFTLTSSLQPETADVNRYLLPKDGCEGSSYPRLSKIAVHRFWPFLDWHTVYYF